MFDSIKKNAYYVWWIVYQYKLGQEAQNSSVLNNCIYSYFNFLQSFSVL